MLKNGKKRISHGVDYAKNFNVPSIGNKFSKFVNNGNVFKDNWNEVEKQQFSRKKIWASSMILMSKIQTIQLLENWTWVYRRYIHINESYKVKLYKYVNPLQFLFSFDLMVNRRDNNKAEQKIWMYFIAFVKAYYKCACTASKPPTMFVCFLFRTIFFIGIQIFNNGRRNF